MTKRAAIISVLLLGCAFQASAQGVYTTAIGITSPGFLGHDFNLNFYFEAGAPVFGYGYHLYDIDSSLKLVFHGATLGGVQASFSVVNEGEVLDRSRFAAPPFSLDGYQLTLDQPFLVGMDLSFLGGLDGTPTAERFGWAHLEYTAGKLQVLDQATALGGNGIIAGTTTVLPEPSALSLIGTGAVGLFFARRLKFRRKKGPPVG